MDHMTESNIVNAINRVEDRVKLEGIMISALLIILIVVILIKF